MEIRSFEKTPACVGIIVDGNRRWARAQGLQSAEGHLVGYEKLKEVARWARGFGVKHLIAFALSTENLERSKEEVDALMDLCRVAIPECIGALAEERIRVRIIGDKKRFPEDIQTLMWKLKRRLRDDDALWEDDAFELVLALGYGGRQEIETAAEAYAAQPILLERNRPHTFADLLSTHGTPDPDLIIRTGGEQRLSGFLPYQSVYSELFFLNTLWPDFSYWHLLATLAEYQTRQRRFGK